MGMGAPIPLRLHVGNYRSQAAQQPHAHDELHFSLILSGAVEEKVGGSVVTGQSLSVVSKDAGVRHANRYGTTGARIARLTMPGGSLGILLDDPRRIADWRWTHSPDVAAPYLRLVGRYHRDGSTGFEPTDPDVLDLLASFTARKAAEARGSAPAWLVQVMEEMEARWTPALQVADVATRAGVHPVYLARCVRRWFGTGVAEELRRLRLRAAARALTSSARRVSDLAYDHGFADEAHLSRSFRDATGLPPARFRSLVDGLRPTARGQQVAAIQA